MSQFRPLLAVDADIQYISELVERGDELYGSPKIDGMRAIVYDGALVSRNLKPIPNGFVQQWARETGLLKL